MVNSLNETIELMTSSDYKDRFKAEYYQLEYRYNKLKKMMDEAFLLQYLVMKTLDEDEMEKAVRVVHAALIE